MRLILASTSPYRKMLLDRLQINYEIIPPEVIEDNPHHLEPAALAADLAERKARNIAMRFPQALCIGSDQVPAVGHRSLEKPLTRENTIRQLAELSGQTVYFYAGLCVLCLEKNINRISVTPTQVVFRPLTRSMIEAYVDKEPAFDCAGGAKAEGLGIALAASLQSTDPTALIGLPLIQLVSDLIACGINILGKG